MTKDEAKAAVLREWLALPPAARRTERQAALYAIKIKDRYRFRSKADRYQVVKGWLQNRRELANPD